VALLEVAARWARWIELYPVHEEHLIVGYIGSKRQVGRHLLGIFHRNYRTLVLTLLDESKLRKRQALWDASGSRQNKWSLCVVFRYFAEGV
jgi:hypothetical protein